MGEITCDISVFCFDFHEMVYFMLNLKEAFVILTKFIVTLYLIFGDICDF